MTAVLQRVGKASVTVDGKVAGSCGKGLCILLGVKKGDSEGDAALLVSKISKLRIFSDSDGKMNLSAKDIGGEALVIPNFTLLGDYRRGNRPEYLNAEAPARAKELYIYFTELLKKELTRVERGVFGAHMTVKIENDGPVTMVMDSNELKGKQVSAQ